MFRVKSLMSNPEEIRQLRCEGMSPVPSLSPLSSTNNHLATLYKKMGGGVITPASPADARPALR